MAGYGDRLWCLAAQAQALRLVLERCCPNLYITVAGRDGDPLARPAGDTDLAGALIDAASAEGHDLYTGSGFRSEAYQAGVFAAQVKRWGDEETANRYSARPGHSQHQLGTTVDFTSTFAAFRRSPAADWLRDNAHRFGFVLPYTPAAGPLTGYVDEPWHGRWVGRDLAGQLQAAGYQDWTSFDADDVIGLVRIETGFDGSS